MDSGDSAPKMPANGAFTVDVTVPDFKDYGSYTLVAGVPFLVGVSTFHLYEYYGKKALLTYAYTVGLGIDGHQVFQLDY